MKIEIRHLEKVKEGVMLYAVVPSIERPLTPHYNTGDIEEEKQKKRDFWREKLKEFDIKEKEIMALHLEEAELIQKENK